jgi:O-antigen/teichoic acid export membrane protein
VSSLTRSALTGVAWNWTGSAVLVVAQILSTAATARLISPSGFGAYASALALVGLASYFSMGSIGTGLLRRSTLEPAAVGTAAVLCLSTGAATGLAVWLVADPWANAWGVPKAAGLIRILAVSMLVTSAAIVPVVLIRHRLRFGLGAALDTGTQLIGLGVSVALAFALHSPVALAVGQLVSAGCLLVIACSIVRRELRITFVRSEARELVTFSSQVSALSLGAYTANTAPSWFASRTYGAAVLGLYSRANLIVGLPHTYLVTGVMKILYPLYGRVRNDLARTRALIQEGLTLSTGLAWPAYALLAGAAPVVVRVLLGDRWQDAAPLVALCALIACGDFPCSLLTNAAEALGWMRAISLRQFVFLAGVGTSIAVAHFAGLDLRWLLAGVAVAQWLAYGLTLVPFVERGLLASRPLLRTQSIHAAIALVVYAVMLGATTAADGWPIAAQVACVAAVALLACAALVRFRARYPAGRLLARRVATIAPETGGWRWLLPGAAVR